MDAHLETWLRENAARVTEAEGCELYEVSVRGAGQRMVIQVTVDREGGVTVEECARISRRLGALLDESETAVAQAFVLEVSSPGLTRPLRQAADYERFRGRLALVHTRAEYDGKRSFRGTLAGLAAHGEAVRVADRDLGREIEVPFAAIEWARLDYDAPDAGRRGRR